MDSLDGNPSLIPARTEPSIKKFMWYITWRIDHLRSDLHSNKTDCNEIKTGTETINARTVEACNEIMNSTLNSLERLNQEFRQLQYEEKGEETLLKQQLGALNHEKMKLEQNVALLTSRVGGSEGDVGVTLRLPNVDSS